MRTLDEIAIKYKTDKSSLSHNYTKRYSCYFDKIRLEKLKILEIGIDKGYSLSMWKEYFENSEITGIDIVNLTQLKEKRIHIEKGDQTDTNFLKSINEKHGPFDIIIDDGSHNNYHMKISFDYLFPLLKNGGYYVVEDLHACYWGKTHGTGRPVFIKRLKEIIDHTNSSGKSGCANIQLDYKDSWVNKKNASKMNWWEKSIEFLHLYRSIVFIKKYPQMEKVAKENYIHPSFSYILLTLKLSNYIKQFKEKLKILKYKLRLFIAKIPGLKIIYLFMKRIRQRTL